MDNHCHHIDSWEQSDSFHAFHRQLVAELRLLRFHEEFYDSIEINVGDAHMDSAGARSSKVDRQDQVRSACVTSSSRQEGDHPATRRKNRGLKRPSRPV